MKRKSNLDNFAPEDGSYLKRWDLYEPLFDNFYILGPEVFNSASKPTCLFQYPLKYHIVKDKSHNEDSQSALKTPTQLKIENNGEQLCNFLFPDGIHFIENDENYQICDSSIIDTFSKPPKVYDRIIFIKSDGSIPHYYFCLRFRCSPFSRPATFGLNELESIINELGCFDINNNYLNDQAKQLYLEKMKKYFMNDFILFQSTKICPSCLFAFCFETRHPFHDLYFKLIKSIVYVESSGRAMAINLHSIINQASETNIPIKMHIQLTKSMNEFTSSNSNDTDNDFIIINKVESENIFESESIITIRDLSESESSNQSSESRRSRGFCVPNVDEKIIADKNDLSFSWPENSFISRDNLLRILYNEIVLPEIGEKIAIRINRSNLTKFLWRRPTIEEYCMSISIFGIEPLLEWINVDDFINLISLIFLECSIIVYGTEMELIYRLVSSLSHIIFPFSWMFLIMTIIPESNLGFLDSPVPFIAGLFKSELGINKIINLPDFSDILIIDIDDHHIIWPKNKYPKISCFSLYRNSLLPFCSKKENHIDHHNLYKRFYPEEVKKRTSEVICIQNDEISENTISPIMKIKKKSNHLYFDLNRISEIVKTVLNTNREVFISKIHPSIVTRVKRDELDVNGTNAISSMMVDELYLSQFPDQKNDIPFIEAFMKSQMFISYRQQACKLKSDEEIDSLHLICNSNTSSKMKNDSTSIIFGFDINKV